MKRIAAALLALILLALAVGLPTIALAGPVAVAQNDGARITLYNDPCRMSHVVDLPYRATWEENGVLHEGCYGMHQAIPVVVMYFTDRSIALAPRGIFAAVSGT